MQKSINPIKNLKNQHRKNNFASLFIFLWLWIAFVSSFDTYLVVKLRSEMKTSEQNPIARWIMAHSNWDVSLFVGLKMFFTILALGYLVLIFSEHTSICVKVISVIATLQMFLLIYLVF